MFSRRRPSNWPKKGREGRESAGLHRNLQNLTHQRGNSVKFWGLQPNQAFLLEPSLLKIDKCNFSNIAELTTDRKSYKLLLIEVDNKISLTCERRY